MIKTIPNDPQIDRVVFYPKFSAVCSVGLAPFHGVMEIEFIPAENLLEFESLELWLFSIANDKMTIESLCRLAFNKIWDAVNPDYLKLTVNAETTVHAPAIAIIERGENR